MSNKQISKDNREYWQRKLSRKFDEKKSAIQSLHKLEINETTKKNYPIFIKRLGILKDLENIKKSQKEFNDYSSNFKKRLEDKRQKLKLHYDSLNEKLKDYEKVEKLTGISYELTTRLKYQIQSVDGNKDQKFIDNFVDNEFLALDTRAYRKYMSEITPDIDMTFEYTSQKGNKHTLDIPLGIDFFWPAADK